MNPSSPLFHSEVVDVVDESEAKMLTDGIDKDECCEGILCRNERTRQLSDKSNSTDGKK